MNTQLSQTRLPQLFSKIRLNRGLTFGLLIIGALLAFEIFNYSTTEFALNDLLGELSFASIRWATILAVAFCGIDFAGIARLFTPEEGADEPAEVWYLFGAWLLAATMNAMLTWWGVSIAILNHQSLGNSVIARETMLRAVPIFVAVMVWLIRVLIIGTFSVAGERLFSQSTRRINFRTQTGAPVRSLNNNRTLNQGVKNQTPGYQSFNPAPKASIQDQITARNEPTYHPLNMQARPKNPTNQVRR
jgi:hypothetical protein